MTIQKRKFRSKPKFPQSTYLDMPPSSSFGFASKFTLLD